MSKIFLRHTLIKKYPWHFSWLLYLYTFSLYEKYQVRVITVFTVFWLLTDFVCIYNYEFWLSLCKIARSSVILLLPLCLMLPENCENRNDPDLVQAFLKKWWVESDFKAPNLPLSLRLKVSSCHYNSIYNNNLLYMSSK
jgi:hypothetical protein